MAILYFLLLLPCCRIACVFVIVSVVVPDISAGGASSWRGKGEIDTESPSILHTKASDESRVKKTTSNCSQSKRSIGFISSSSFDPSESGNQNFRTKDREMVKLPNDLSPRLNRTTLSVAITLKTGRCKLHVSQQATVPERRLITALQQTIQIFHFMLSGNSTNPSKKPKMTTSEQDSKQDDFEVVKEYLLRCPHVSRTSPAIKSALEGLEKEKQRRIRDAKLQAKFGGTSTNAAVSSSATDPDVVVVENMGSPTIRTVKYTSTDEDQDSMEWQDVQQHKSDDEDPDGSAVMASSSEIVDDGSSYLGQQLSKTCVDAISEYRAHVSSPVAAIAVAFHAALRSPLLGFACTGIPEDPKSSGGGFAPPVRELPKTQFLPLHWENNPTNILLRYRKNGTGALVLKVQTAGGSIEAEATVQVSLFPANTKEPPTQSMNFPLANHINLDSWNAALKAGKTHKIAPLLHYKQLAGMLSKFCQIFDLGAVVDTEGNANTEMPYVDNTVVYGKEGSLSTKKSSIPISTPRPYAPVPSVGVAWKEGRVPASLDQAFPSACRHPMPGGDFADDLLPAGLQDPRFIRGGHNPGRMGGNLMGPGHPMFAGDGIGGNIVGDLPVGGPGSMQPRFDLVYPPGIDDGPNPNSQQKGGRQKPSRTGEPNPDHLPPPNSLGGGNNMFL
jgi:hypothetical protein